MKNIKAIKSDTLSTKYDDRYIIIDENTGEVLDDAQGYGYKSIRNAYAAFSYRNRDKTKDKEKRKKETEIKNWMKEHKDFVNLMDTIAFEILKGSWGPDEKFNAKLVSEMLEKNNLEVNFKASELLKVWKKSR